MQAKASLSRRAAFGALAGVSACAIGAGVCTPAPAQSAAPGISAAWSSFIEGDARRLHPGLPDVAKRAASAGLAFEDISAIVLTGDHQGALPAMFFDAHNGGHHSVSPQGVLLCSWVRQV